MSILPYLIASAVPSLPTASLFALRRRGGGRPMAPAPAPLAADEQPAAPPTTSFRTEPVDVRLMVLERIEALAERAAASRVRIGFAVEAGLACAAAPAALRAALTATVAAAIEATPGGAVLVSARRHGGRVRITVADDGGLADEAAETGRLRASADALALFGASLQVRARGGEGTTVEMRLPDFTQTAHAPEAAAPSPAEAHAAKQVERVRAEVAACA